MTLMRNVGTELWANKIRIMRLSLARVAILTRGSVSEKKRKVDAYRNTQLHMMKHPLQRKSYRHQHK